MKNKLLPFFLLTFLLGCFTTTNAQVYHEVSKDVQVKMDENKDKGLAINEGIFVDYELTIEGVQDAQSASEFESLLKEKCGLVKFNYLSNGHVIFTVPARYNLDGMAPVVKGSRFGFGLFFKEVYHL